jgi:tRNA threonylcarbamoyladenosine modification (KEOPS) complex  Pcc1 subunit
LAARGVPQSVDSLAGALIEAEDAALMRAFLNGWMTRK